MTDLTFPQNDGYVGAKVLSDGLVQFNTISFMVQQILAGVGTAMLVQVKSVVPGSGLLPGRVVVQPMVNQVDGYGNAVPHGPIYDIPYMRLQGGANAVIIDPVVGDIGLAVFASRDISSVKANGKVSNPGSRRVFDLADGLYFGGFLNGVPTQYVQFTDAGIKVLSPTLVTVQAPNISLIGAVAVTGALTATQGITAGEGGADQVGLQTHQHPTAANGPPSSPTAGT